GGGVGAGPPPERPAREPPARGLSVEPERSFQEAPERVVLEEQVGDGGERRAHLPHSARPGDDPVPERDPALRLHLRPGLGVDLGDLHALRTDGGADPAARAVVQGRIRRAVVGPEPLQLWPDILRPGEERCDVRHRTERLADRALHAVIQRSPNPFHRVHQEAHSTIADATANPDARARPLPESSRHGSAPPSAAPAVKRLGKATFPSASSGRRRSSTATPARPMGWSSKYRGTNRGSPAAGTPDTPSPNTDSWTSP